MQRFARASQIGKLMSYHQLAKVRKQRRKRTNRRSNSKSSNLPSPQHAMYKLRSQLFPMGNVQAAWWQATFQGCNTFFLCTILVREPVPKGGGSPLKCSQEVSSQLLHTSITVLSLRKA